MPAEKLRPRPLVVVFTLAIAGGVLAGPPDSQLDELAALIKDGKYAQAEEGARSLLTTVEKRGGADSLDAAQVLDLLVESLWRGSKVRDPMVVQLAERAIAIKERALGKDHIDLAKSLANLGTLLRLSGDVAAARPPLERALAIREKTLGPDHPEVAKGLNSLANLMTDTGDYVAARPLLERALSIREKAFGPDHIDVALGLDSLATLVQSTGDYAAALPMRQRALAIREKSDTENPNLASSINNLASLYYQMGDYASARPLYERALALREKLLGPDHMDVTQTLNNFGYMLHDMGDDAAARLLLERALASREKVLGPDHPGVAIVLNNLGNVLEATGDFAAAKPLFERALAINEKALGPDHPRMVGPLNNLSNVLSDLGDYQAARPLAERALAISEKALGPNHPDVAAAMTNLASLVGVMGDFAAARALIERGLDIRRNVLGPAHPAVAESLSRLAIARALLGETAGALDAALEAERIARDHLRLTGRSLAEEQALRYAAARTSGLAVALTLAGKGIDGPSRRRVFDALVRSRAVVFDEMAARQSSAGGADPRVSGLVESLAETRAHLADLVVRGTAGQTPEAYRAQVDAARGAREKAEQALAVASAGFAREQRRGRIGVDDVAASLPPGSALVAFVEYDKDEIAAETETVTTYIAMVLKAGERDPEFVTLGSAAEIDPLVMRWRKEIAEGMTGGSDLQQSEAASRATGTALRRRIWDPLAAGIQGSTRVFVVPDGTLNLVNLSALPAEQGRYLVELGPLLHSFSTERDVVTTDEVPQGNGLLAVGSPDYEAGQSIASASHGGPGRTFRGERSACGAFASVRFGPLPGSGREAGEVAAMWDRRRPRHAMRLIGAAATEAKFKEQGPGRRILHLATHGFFLVDACAFDDGAGEAPPPGKGRLIAAGESPLALSGLALAGANHRDEAPPDGEDGILTAEEIAAMDLSGVEWAVLSGCDTGLGEVRAGEGLFGLRRAFQVAGAHTVITSLWSVADDTTRAWMRDLYQERLAGASTAEAVRSASRRMIKSLKRTGLPPHPYYWAAFVALGDWR